MENTRNLTFQHLWMPCNNDIGKIIQDYHQWSIYMYMIYSMNIPRDRSHNISGQ